MPEDDEPLVREIRRLRTEVSTLHSTLARAGIVRAPIGTIATAAIIAMILWFILVFITGSVLASMYTQSHPH